MILKARLDMLKGQNKLAKELKLKRSIDKVKDRRKKAD